MNILKEYNPTITTLSKKELITYMSVMKSQLTPEMVELLIDITVEFESEISDCVEGTPRAQLFKQLASILDGNLES
jgi:hypothetical protein